MKRTLLIFLMAAVLAPLPVSAKATFNVINMDGVGEGFNDPTPFSSVGGNWGTTVGEARLIAFQYAADVLGTYVNSDVPIEVEARMDPLTCTLTGAVLGTGTAKTKHINFPYAPYANTWYPQALANSRAGVDLAPADADIEAVFNSSLTGGTCAGGAQWYYGLDGNCPSGDFDFVSVVLHELTHGSGFQTYLNLNTGGLFMGYNDHYELNMERHYYHPFGYAYLTDAERLGGYTDDPNLHWIGPSVQASQFLLTGGVSNGHVRLHGPSTLQPGASLNHFAPALTPNQLMEPNYAGPNHDIGLAVNAFDDVGWRVRNTTLDICNGSLVEIDDGTGSPPGNLYASGSGLTRGMFFTALKDFTVCGAGIKVWDPYVQGPYITAELYEANGTTRGALLETGFLTVTQSAEQFHMVPLTGGTVLQACNDYELVFTVGTVNGYPIYDKNLMPNFPFDAEGLIRVYELSDGSGVVPPPAPELPHMALLGTPASTPSAKIALTNPSILWGTCIDDSRAHGAFVTADQTISVCNVAFEAKFDAWHLGKTIRANIYESPGLVRGPLVATGTATVSLLGLVDHTIPINAVLHEGIDYDIEVEYPQRTPYSCWLEGPSPAPFSLAGVLTVLDGEMDGNPNAPDLLLPRLKVGYEPLAGGESHDLVGGVHHETPTTFTLTNTDLGAYVLARGEVSTISVGWLADIPAGEQMDVSIYESAGLARGLLRGHGTAVSTGSGLRWHDALVNVDMTGGAEYDISIAFHNVNSFPVYDEAAFPGIPYNAQGLVDVLDAEEGGDPTATTNLVHFRINVCQSSVVGVPGDPEAVPAVALFAPRPNPVRDGSVLTYSLSTPGRARLQLFDVRGRLVTTLLDDVLPAGPGEVRLDGRRLASGLYFAQLQSGGRHSSQRVVVLH